MPPAVSSPCAATTATSLAKPRSLRNTLTLSCRSRVKKPAQSVNTQLSSYDRTDPFFAFNTLIKLLGTLPSRVGGCQFKFTPEEHKLSLHLLSIVEPFVGLAPSRRTLTRQPTEVLDSIIFYVDSRADLLSFALSCHRMHDIIFPRHFNYRTIRCRVSSISVWNHLIVNKSLARNVRRLEIMDERDAEQEMVPPGILLSDTDLESTDDELGLHDKQERYLASALVKMSALTSFSWSCNHSPISIDNVWPTLMKCQSLREVQINDNLVFTSVTSEENRSPRKSAVLPRMEAMTLRSTSHVYGSTKQPDLSRINGILNHCPNLKSLDITYNLPRTSSNAPGSRPQVDELLLSGRWPNLTVLSLTNLRCSPTTGFSSASSFLFAHQNLEVLHLDITAGTNQSRLALPPNSLPRLRELRASKEVATSVLQCPSDHPRPLETLKGLWLSGATHAANSTAHLSDCIFLTHLKRAAKTVKRIELTGWNEMEDVRRLVDCAPGLTWLDVGKKRGGMGGSGAARDKDKNAHAVATNTMEWANLLSDLPDLATFHGVKFFYEVSPQAALPPAAALSANISMTDRSRVRKNDEVAGVLAWKCPKLRRLDYWEEGAGKIIVLVRDGQERTASSEKDKTRWEVRRIKV